MSSSNTSVTKRGIFSRKSNNGSSNTNGNIHQSGSHDVEDGNSSNVIYIGPTSQKYSTRLQHARSGATPLSAASSSNTCSSFVFGGQAYYSKKGHKRKRHRYFCSRVFSSFISRLLLLGIVLLTALRLVQNNKSPKRRIRGTTYKQNTDTITADTTKTTTITSSSSIQQQQQQQQVHTNPRQYEPPMAMPLSIDLSKLPSLEWERQREIDRRKHLDSDAASNHGVQIHHNQIHHNSEQINQLLEAIAPKWARRFDTTSKTKDVIQQTAVTKETNDITSEIILDGNNSNNENKLAQLATTPRILKSMITNGTCPPLLDSTMVSVSLVIHSTIDRLWLMEETCRRWKGPIVLVVYFNASSTSEKPWLQVLDWNSACPQVKLIPVQASQDEQEWQYPVNKLRNIGLDALETTLFLMMDADFLPSGDLEANIKNHFLSTSKFYASETNYPPHRIAMVVPAFERIHATCNSAEECKQFLKNDRHFIPLSFDGIDYCVKMDNCQVFQGDNNWEGHYTTKSESWLRGEFLDDKNLPKKIPCFHSFRYEPYVVLQWCGKDNGAIPYYDERFYGYGKNKIEYISHLRFLNYSFHILPEGFIVHHPHLNSKAKKVWNNMDNYNLHAEMDNLYPEFLAELSKMYGKPTLRQCNK